MAVMIRFIYPLFMVSILVSLGSCTSMDLGVAPVKIVDPAQINELGTCKDLGKVVETSQYGRQELLKNLRGATADLGGNILLSRLQIEKTMGLFRPAEVTQGKAFRCSPEVVAKLMDAAEF